MNIQVIEGVPQIDRHACSGPLIEWFDDRVEELYADDKDALYSLFLHAKGVDVFNALECGDGALDQLIYDCCCEQAWDDVRKKAMQESEK